MVQATASMLQVVTRALRIRAGDAGRTLHPRTLSPSAGFLSVHWITLRLLDNSQTVSCPM